MAKEEGMRFVGVVEEVLPNAMFRVTIKENNLRILAYLGGKLRKNEINISNGDEVTVEMSPYDLSKGRVVYRNK